MIKDKHCHCGSKESFTECCQKIILDMSLAKTAEQLMRARYSSFIVLSYDFLRNTLDPTTRDSYDEESIKKWAESAEWLGLEIVSCKDGKESDTKGEVEFIATYMLDNEKKIHHEQATFIKKNNQWYFQEGKWVKPKPIQVVKIGRNEACPCGSGKKYKKCCGRNSG